MHVENCVRAFVDMEGKSSSTRLEMFSPRPSCSVLDVFGRILVARGDDDVDKDVLLGLYP